MVGTPHGDLRLSQNSAGAAMAMAVLQLAFEEQQARAWAVTGAVTLRGEIMAVGGVRRKVRAHRAMR